jgi:formyltetrahydrofolate deformylase
VPSPTNLGTKFAIIEPMHQIGRLVIACPDGPGIVATVSDFLFQQGANVIHSDQHSTDNRGGRFFMRIEFDLENLDSRLAVLEAAFMPIATRFAMSAQWTNASQPKKVSIFASKEDHCLQELLWQLRAGDLVAEVTSVIANHPEIGEVVKPFGIPFIHIPVAADTKPEAEARQMEAVTGNDFLILARYMQVLSPTFVAAWSHRIINIHHSFLPAFAGANPYAQAHTRGVKLIGATAHYVTSELDAGPIIEQGVERVDHRSDIRELKRIGRHVERIVLARAVKWHLEDRVLVDGNRTIVFS